MSNYLFLDFLLTFTRFFKLQKDTSLITNSQVYFTWMDLEYRAFMIQMMVMLEPVRIPKRTILVDELEECAEVMFINEGQVVVGYEINKQKKYCLRFTDYCVVSAYNVTFNERAAFIYTALTNLNGFFIRKQNWYYLLQDNPLIAYAMRRSIIFNYTFKIRSKVLAKKNMAMQEVVKRNDFQRIMAWKQLDQTTLQNVTVCTCEEMTVE